MTTFLFPPTMGRIRATARARLLSESLGHHLGRPTTVEVAESYAELERRVLRAEVELAWAPPSICARAEPHARAIFKAVRGGATTYRAALVSRNSDLLTLDSLGGKRAAWVDPLSTGGHLLALMTLRRHLGDSGALAEQRFHGTYQGALLAVLGGEADIASIYTRDDSDAAIREALSEHIGAQEVQLRPFCVTAESPSDGLIITRSEDDAQTELVDALEPLIDGSRGSSLLLELLDADALQRAAANDYWAVRQALVEL